MTKVERITPTVVFTHADWVRARDCSAQVFDGRRALVDFLRAHGAAIEDESAAAVMPRGLRLLTRELVAEVERVADPFEGEDAAAE